MNRTRWPRPLRPIIDELAHGMSRARLPRRLRRPAGKRRPVEQCRPVTVVINGEEITVPVLAEEPMSTEAQAALAAVVAAARQMFNAQPPNADLCPGCGFATRSSIHRRRCEPEAAR